MLKEKLIRKLTHLKIWQLEKWTIAGAGFCCNNDHLFQLSFFLLTCLQVSQVYNQTSFIMEQIFLLVFHISQIFRSKNFIS